MQGTDAGLTFRPATEAVLWGLPLRTRRGEPLHVGLEHPNLVWIAASGVIAFVAGLLVNLYRTGDDRPTGAGVPDEETD